MQVEMSDDMKTRKAADGKIISIERDVLNLRTVVLVTDPEDFTKIVVHIEPGIKQSHADGASAHVKELLKAIRIRVENPPVPAKPVMKKYKA
jgi:hypothetical protein